MVAILNFRSFCKTQKCLYLDNCARWSEFNKIFDLLDISAEYPCQFSKYFCLAKYSGHFEFFAKFAKHKNAYILKTVLDRADCADFGCHNSIRLENEHFLNTLALTFISFSGRFVFAMQKHYLFFASDPLVIYTFYLIVLFVPTGSIRWILWFSVRYTATAAARREIFGVNALRGKQQQLGSPNLQDIFIGG